MLLLLLLPYICVTQAKEILYFNVLKGGSNYILRNGILVPTQVGYTLYSLRTGRISAIATYDPGGGSATLDSFCPLLEPTPWDGLSPPLNSSIYSCTSPTDLNYIYPNTPWFSSLPLRFSIFRVSGDTSGTDCIDISYIQYVLESISSFYRRMTRNMLNVSIESSFISPTCIDITKQQPSATLRTPIDRAIQILNEAYSSGSSEYQWLADVPQTATARVFIVNDLYTADNYTLLLTAAQFFNFTARNWTYGPWIYLSSSSFNPEAFLRKLGYLSGLDEAVVQIGGRRFLMPTDPTGLYSPTNITDPWSIMGTGSLNGDTAYSIRHMLYAMGLIPPSKVYTITFNGVDHFSTNVTLYTLPSCEFNGESPRICVIELMLDNEPILANMGLASLLLEYRTDYANSFGGASLYITAGKPTSPGRFKSVVYNANAGFLNDIWSWESIIQPLPGYRWVCNSCSGSLSIIVTQSTQPRAPMSVFDRDEYVYVAIEYSRTQQSISNETVVGANLGDFDLIYSPGVLCSQSNVSDTALEYVCGSYFAAPASPGALFVPAWIPAASPIQYYTERSAFLWSYYYLVANMTHGVSTVTIKPTNVVASLENRKLLTVNLDNTYSSITKVLPGQLLVDYTCMYTDDSQTLEFYYSDERQTNRVFLVFTPSDYEQIRTITNDGYLLVTSPGWSIRAWRVNATISGVDALPLRTKRIATILPHLRRLPYTNTQCSFIYHVQGFRSDGFYANYSATFSFDNRIAPKNRIAVGIPDYHANAIMLLSPFLQLGETCDSASFDPIHFVGKKWYDLPVKCQSYDTDAIFFDFAAGIPQYLIIFLRIMQKELSIDCRMLSVIEGEARIDGQPALISLRVDLRPILPEFYIPEEICTSTLGISFSFSEDVTLENVRYVRHGYKGPSQENRLDPVAFDTTYSSIFCTPNEQPTNWTYQPIVVSIFNQDFLVKDYTRDYIYMPFSFQRGIYTFPNLYMLSALGSWICPPGNYFWPSLKGTSECHPCIAGHYCRNSVMRPCPMGFFSRELATDCIRSYAGNYTQLSLKDLIFDKPEYYVYQQYGGGATFTDNCAPYQVAINSFCDACPLTGYICLPGQPPHICPTGFMCIMGEAFPCVGGKYQSLTGEGDCVNLNNTRIVSRSTLNVYPYETTEVTILQMVTPELWHLFIDRPNPGPRPCPAGYSCTCERERCITTRCKLQYYSAEGMDTCVFCGPTMMQNSKGDECELLPLLARQDAGIDPDDPNICTPAWCRGYCDNNICITTRVLSQSAIWAIAVVTTCVLVVAIVLLGVYLPRCRVKRRRAYAR
ncbi:hypothetical protein GMRT_14346 [Giardia muris]|uniref:Uncharacterized protein n=1 Tax=Giardia muris TaxID=5742 RepID=A0A4Z1SQQ3_GIAMU|nr:hypothetical protein GMRT_14346 [Giardia muris]|eukprot:TNJ28194.1 hypothetical protein GMRT_14346 [Giardia muris]